MRIEQVGPHGRVEKELAAVLVDCVEGGATVGFLAPLSEDVARTWWRAELLDRATLTWVARDDSGTIIGTVQLKLATKPNSPHRGEVAKLLVHRAARGAGVATALLGHLEAEAVRNGRWLLLLDTEAGSPAEHLYARLGWARVGVVVDHALTPAGVLSDTTFMTKRLRRAAERFPVPGRLPP